jgi:hypothetical protein
MERQAKSMFQRGGDRMERREIDGLKAKIVQLQLESQAEKGTRSFEMKCVNCLQCFLSEHAVCGATHMLYIPLQC